MTLKKPITTWESLDPDNQVELVILLAIPEAEAGSLHLTLLAELSTRLADPDYKQRLLRSKTAEELYRNLDARPEERPVASAGRKTGRVRRKTGGGLGRGYEAVYDVGIDGVLSIVPGPIHLEEAIRRGPELVEAAAERAMRLVRIQMDS